MSAKETAVRKATTVPTSATGAAAKSAVIYIGDLDPATVVFQAAGTAASTFKYKVSVDGTNYYQCGADLVETTAFSDSTNMSTAGSNPQSAGVWARLDCSAFTSITSLTFVVAGMPKSL